MLFKASAKKEMKLQRKPWITKAILELIESRHKLLKSYYKSSDLVKIQQYNKYCNQLTYLRIFIKGQYYDSSLKKKTKIILNKPMLFSEM